MGKKRKKRERRQVILVAREGVLSEILDTYAFPTENHRKVIEKAHRETLKEMKKIGLTRLDDDDLDDFIPQIMDDALLSPINLR